MLRRIAAHSLLLLTGEGFSRGLTFVTTVVLARVLGPGAFGVLAFAQALLGYALLVGDGGLATHGVRAVANAPAEARAAWTGLATVRLGLSTAALAIAMLAAWALPAEPLVRTVALVTLAAALPTALLPDWTLRGLQRMGRAAVLNAVPAAVTLVLVLACVHAPGDVPLAALARTAGSAAAAVLGMVWMRRWPFTRAAQQEGAAWRSAHGGTVLMRAGATILAANLAVLVYNSADQLLLFALADERAVGLYGGAYRILQLPFAAFYALTAASLPALSAAMRDDPAGARRTAARLEWLGLAAGAALAAALLWVRAPLLQALYGPGYAAAAPALGVLALAIPLDFAVSVRGLAAIAAGRERTNLVLAAIGAAANVAANLVLIPRAGIVGAAWATVGTYVVLYLLYRAFLDPGEKR
ncbi:MAG: oligosaccharide flippase family protein [Candidatus Eisenbacteria bacterium]|nr:oligosaccharide flippase family protein [Candidatus Eisenbacteria bacterium]